MTPINFKASFLKTVYIPQKVSDLNYKNQEVSIVELDPKNQKDVMALAETACKWESIAPGFSSEIYNEVLKPKMYPDIVAEHYLALTTQNKDYKNLDANKVLGLALFSETMDSENQLKISSINIPIAITDIYPTIKRRNKFYFIYNNEEFKKELKKAKETNPYITQEMFFKQLIDSKRPVIKIKP